MRKKGSAFKAVLGTLVFVSLCIYGIYLNPLEPDNTLHTKVYKDVAVKVETPDRFEGNLNEKTVNLTVQGTKDKMKEIKDLKPDITVKLTAEEGIQKVKPEVQGLQGYIYSLDTDEMTGSSLPIDPEEVKPKVLIKGEPKKEIASVEVLETINGYFNSNQLAILGEVKVTVNADGLDREKELEGTVTVEDMTGEIMNKDLVDKDKVKVKVVTK